MFLIFVVKPTLRRDLKQRQCPSDYECRVIEFLIRRHFQFPIIIQICYHAEFINLTNHGSVFFVNSFDLPSMFSCPMLEMFGENSINPSVLLSLQMRWLVLIVTCTCTYCVSLTVCCSVLGTSSLKQHLFYIISTDVSLVWDAKHLLSLLDVV